MVNMIEESECEKRLLYGRLAAFMDGEGSIIIGRSKKNNTYRLVLQIANTDRELIKWLEKKLGGRTDYDYALGGNNKDRHGGYTENQHTNY